jgi:hypothetical protein
MSTTLATHFPRQPNREGGWTIDVKYLLRIQHYTKALEDKAWVNWVPGLEEIEAVLLALEAAESGGAPVPTVAEDEGL